MDTLSVSQTDTHPIRKGRARHKLTQEALGRAVGVTKATVCKWEQGQALPEPAVAMDVAKRLKIPLEDVYASARVA
ncbi:helix-turn-helix domain-containing protein [Pseudoxanthomonas sp. LjRoot143]